MKLFQITDISFINVTQGKQLERFSTGGAKILIVDVLIS